MNISMRLNTVEAQELLDIDSAAKVKKLKDTLDVAFMSKISTPEQVLHIADLLQQYKLVSGESYKITFEENSIV